MMTAATIITVVLVGCGQATSGQPSGSEDRTGGEMERSEKSEKTSGSEDIKRPPSDGGLPNKKPVPDVVGMRVEAACRKLNKVGYGSDVVATRKSDRYESGRIIGQRPTPFYEGKRSVGGAGEGVYLIASAPFPIEKFPSRWTPDSDSYCTNDPESNLETFRLYYPESSAKPSSADE